VVVLAAAMFLALKLHAYVAVMGLAPRGRWML
jgi:hypothetical protein